MANIKGITIEIDGKTTGLQKSLQGVDNEAKKVSSELKEVDRLLKFNPGNAEAVKQKQKLLAEQISITSTKLTQLKNAERDVDTQFKSGKIGEEKYRAFKREIEFTEGALNGYRGQLTKLTTDQERLSQNTERLSTFFRATKTSVDDYADVLGTRLVNSIKNGKASADDLEIAINKVGKSSLGSKADIIQMKEALDRINDGSSIDVVKTDLEGLKTTSKNTEEQLATVGRGITAGNLMQATEILSQASDKIINFGKNAQDAFRKVDDGLDVITKETGKSSDEFKKQFDNISDSMPIESFEQLGLALGALDTQFGFTDGVLEESARKFLKFSDINTTDVKTSIESAKSAMSAYNLENSELAMVLDSVTATSQSTGVATEKLFESVTKGAPQIKALGLSFSEGAELIGQFEKAGVDGDAALAALNKSRSNFAKDGKSLTEGLAEMKNKLADAKDETEKLNIANEVFGDKGGAKMLDAIERGEFKLDDFAKAAKNSAGIVEGTFEKTLDPIDRQIIATQILDKTMADFGATIAESLVPMIDAISDIVKVFSALPGPVKTVVVIVGGLIALIGLLAPSIAAIISIVTSFGAASGAASVGTGMLSASLLPIIGVIALIVVAIVAIILVFKNWGTITDWFKKVWESFGSWFKGFWNGIVNFFLGIWQFIQDNLKTIIEAIIILITGPFGLIGVLIFENWDNIKKFTIAIWESIKGFFIKLMESIYSIFKNTWEGIKSIILGVIESIKNTIFSIWENVKNILVGIWNGLKDSASTIFEGIKNAIVSPIEWAKNKLREIIGGITSLFSNVKFEFPKIKLPHFKISGGFSLTPPSVPSLGVDWYAKGGIMTSPTVFGINGSRLLAGGEAGAEAILPLNSKNLSIIGEQIAKTMRPNSNITINVSGVRNFDEELVEKLVREVDKRLGEVYG